MALLAICALARADISLISAGSLNSANDDGYYYPKPAVPFELPTKLEPVVIVQKGNSASHTSLLSSNANLCNLILSISGYDYPKPKIPFPPVSEYKPVRIVPEYLPPTTPAPRPSGYVYPKPQVPFTLPPPTTPRPPPRQVFIQQKAPVVQPQGYFYPKPKVPFPQPTAPKPVVRGYEYPKPVVPFTLPPPTTQRIYTTQKPVTLPPPTKGEQTWIFLISSNHLTSTNLCFVFRLRVPCA